MADNQKSHRDPEGSAERAPAKVDAPREKEVDQPHSAGRHQLGESTEGLSVTTRAPRGVGEPPADAKADGGGVRELQDAVQKQADEENEKGYRGSTPDPTPNEHYTVAGVTSGKPTPETVVFTPRGK